MPSSRSRRKVFETMGFLATILMYATLIWAGLGAQPARADDPAQPKTTLQKARRVEQACPADFKKYCPGQSADANDMTICLKTFMSDLTFPCRRAVKDAVHPDATATPG